MLFKIEKGSDYVGLIDNTTRVNLISGLTGGIILKRGHSFTKEIVLKCIEEEITSFDIRDNIDIAEELIQNYEDGLYSRSEVNFLIENL